MKMTLLAVILSAFPGLCAAPVELTALPEAKITLHGETQPKGKPESLISGPSGGMLHYSKLEGARVTIEFPSPVTLPHLAVIRYGYDDWAVPAEIEYRVNGAEVRKAKLSAPRTANHIQVKSPEADLLPLGNKPVSSLELTITGVDTRSKQYSGHGILKLAIPKAAAAAPAVKKSGLFYSLKPFPQATVSAISPIKEPERLISPKPEELTVGDVGTFEFKVTFEKAVHLPRIALVKVGWGDWAVPGSIEVKVNDGTPKPFTLTAERVAPDFKAAELPADILHLGSEPVKALEFRVSSVQTKANRHGSFKLYVPEQAVIPLAVIRDCSATSGIEVEVEAAAPVEGAALSAVIHRFRQSAVWTRPLPHLKKGVNRFTVNWSEFGNPQEPESPLTPGNIHQLNLTLPGGIEQAQFRFKPIPARNAADFWERFTMPDFSADGDGWRKGIPANGFGRFGYHSTNGLLTVNLEKNGIFFMADQSHMSLRFGNGGAQSTSYQKVKTGSDHMVLTQLKRFEGAKENKVTSRAYGEFDASRLPERYIASILAPGFLIYSHDAVFTVTPNVDLGAPHLLFMENGKLRWSQGETDLTGLSEGWVVLVFEKRPAQPVLLAFDRKVQKMVRDGNSVGFLFGQPRGFVGIGTPGGNRLWPGHPGVLNSHTGQLTEVSRKLASLLRNYPLQSEMKFKTGDGKVNFAEKFRFISWRNEWGESGETYLPCPPLAAFGADQGYPVTFPAGKPEPFGLDTKFGPYRAWKLSQTDTGRYSLPLPPEDNVLYPNLPSDPRAAEIGAAIAKHIGTDPKPILKGDALGCWWMFSSGMMAQSLFNAEQQQKITANWKNRIDFTLGPRPWHRRTEPFSGISYPLSFAWTDKAQEIQGDPNSGVGAALSGFSNYARFTGDWKMLADNWEIIRRIPLYFYYSHDWAMMQAGCREHTAASAIDMEVITYEGTAGLCRMAKTLGKEDDLAAGRMLLARYALSSSLKWKALSWRAPERPKEEWKAIGIGFNENFGFEVMSARGKNQNYINSEIALSLAWIGDYPCFFEMLLRGNGEEFWRFFEYDYVEKQLDRWRFRHPGRRNWHDANIAPHLYMRMLLGEPAVNVTRELEEQNMLKPDPRMAAESAGFYALYLASDSPVRLLDWGQARLHRFDWNKEAKRIEAELESPIPFTLTFRLNGELKSQTYPAGKHLASWQL